MIKEVAAVYLLTLRQWENDDLAALNLALQGFGVIHKLNRSFGPAYESALIDEVGKPIDKDSLIAAASCEINKRVSEGTFT
jgi:hypothetical protein